MSEASSAELAEATDFHHQLLTRLILGVAGHHGLPMAAEFGYRTLRRQHDERFLRGVGRLGLSHLAPRSRAGSRLTLSRCRTAGDRVVFDCWGGLWWGALAVRGPGLRPLATVEPGSRML